MKSQSDRNKSYKKHKPIRANGRDRDKKFGFIGECIVMKELAKRGTYSQKLNTFFDFDLILENNLMVEVKTSSIVAIRDYRRKPGSIRDIWQFNNPAKRWKEKSCGGRARRCDYYVLVCMDNNAEPIKFYIIPNEVVGKTAGVSIPVNRKTGKDPYEKYIDNWELITGDKHERR